MCGAIGVICRYALLGLIVAGVMTAVVLEVQIPAFSGEVVVAVEDLARGSGTVNGAWYAAGGLVGVFALLSLMRQVYLRIWMYFASEVMQKLVKDGFFQVQRFSADWHTNAFGGATVRKITRGMWAYDQLADTLIIEMGPALLLLVGFAIAMFLREPVMGLYFGGSVIVFLAISISLSLGYVAPANRRSNEADTTLGGDLADAVTCNSVIKSFGAEEREDAGIDRSTYDWRIKSRVSWLRSMDLGAIQSLLIIGLLAGLLAIVVWLAERDASVLEDVVYVITSYFIVNGYLRNIGWQVRNLQRSVNELDDLVEISKTPPQVINAPGAPEFEANRGHIVFDNVRFKYANQPTAIFDDFNVEIAPGEKVALVGESGSGKSTFVKLIQRLYDLDRGRIVIDGQDIAGVTQESLRQSISLVPQEPILFHRTLRENIGYACPQASLEDIVNASKQAHAHEFISQLDDGYETLVGERGIKLSGGERQRVAIARAILADAPILILDEATSSLDSITEHYIQSAIATLMAGRTAIIVAHRLSTIRQVDRILVFDNGHIAEQGTHEELMSKEVGVYRRLYDMQALGFIDTLSGNDDTEGEDAQYTIEDA